VLSCRNSMPRHLKRSVLHEKLNGRRLLRRPLRVLVSFSERQPFDHASLLAAPPFRSSPIVRPAETILSSNRSAVTVQSS